MSNKMKRYCETPRAKLEPCGVGWGATDSSGTKSCYDEPIEQNCHHIVSGDIKQTCPLCGQGK